jgi:IS1 family transposase
LNRTPAANGLTLPYFDDGIKQLNLPVHQGVAYFFKNSSCILQPLAVYLHHEKQTCTGIRAIRRTRRNGKGQSPQSDKRTSPCRCHGPLVKAGRTEKQKDFMNILATDKRAQILSCLVEGCSMRSTSRLTGAAKKTVERMLVSAGMACAEYMDKTMRNLPCKVLQVDEVWSFTFCKQANVPEHLKDSEGIGDTWTWIALDSKSKLVPCFHVGKRDAEDAFQFINNLAGRLASRVQLTSDGHTAYLQAIEDAFGSEIDYAQLIKLYGKNQSSAMEARYSPPVCIGARKKRIIGSPLRGLVSTSHIERQNLTVRMNNRRFTRLTNGFSKKIENHRHMLAISFMHYNFCRIHQTLRVTPAMEAGISDHVWSLEELVSLL